MTRVTVVNTTNEELVLDPTESGAAVGDPPGAPRRIAAHATGRFSMRGPAIAYQLGGDPDRTIYVQDNGAVWAPPTCVVRSAAAGEALAVQVSPAPWTHDHPVHRHDDGAP